MSQRIVNSVAARLSLRAPQRESLEILAKVLEQVPLGKDRDPAESLGLIRGLYPTVEDFEREFPSLCFALATGVGKTRLMGAFIAYLYKAKGYRNFFVLAPNLTIYNKLIADFTPNTPKYVFSGISEFASDPPEIVTGDNYLQGRGVREDARIQRTFEYASGGDVVVNVFNISKIDSEVRGDRTPRRRRLSEYIGESYFDYLAGLDDLVLVMDESHRYRGGAGVRVLNELRPILGLELTATPFTQRAQAQIPFKNVVYSYPLARAIEDGFVKEPAVATRENFDSEAYRDRPEELEQLKLEDAIRIHEQVKLDLELYAGNTGNRRVKPFVLVIARDVDHAKRIEEYVQSDGFFDGQYRDRVAQVNSGQGSVEREENVERLLKIEDPDEPTEIVVHVNMLKEGWDVTNLYTIVPLRAANARLLVEQSIGRGLRLPYGKKTGVHAVDRLTIVDHDRFREIVEDANRADSPLKVQVRYLDKDDDAIPKQRVTVRSALDEMFDPAPAQIESAVVEPAPYSEPTLAEPAARVAAQAALRAIERLARQPNDVPTSNTLQHPEIQAQIVRAATEAIAPSQLALPDTAPRVDVAAVVALVTESFVAKTIDIPRLSVVPTGEVTSGFRDFDLNESVLPRPQPVDQAILIQLLQSNRRDRLEAVYGGIAETEIEKHIVRRLIDKDDIAYDDYPELINKLAGQLVAYLRSYLSNEDDVLNVVRYNEKQLADLVYQQMLAHAWEETAGYEAVTHSGFELLKPAQVAVAASERVRDVRAPVENRSMIRLMIFGGFRKCCYPLQKFQSDPERVFAVICEDDTSVEKWFKPSPGQFHIHYSRDERNYEPDFVVETTTEKLLCEVKRDNEMTDPEVLEKARAAATWCGYASDYARRNGGKPWRYLLIPESAVTPSATIGGLAARYTRTTPEH